MNQKKCQYFVALAEEMNFTKASEALHITQQSLSGSIKRLEEEYGVELFQRKPYLKLTPAGETMLFYSKQMLRNESQMIASLADLSAECSGHLVLGMSRQRIQVFFPGIWERYHNAYPNVSLDLRQSYTLKMADALQAGKLDLFIRVMYAVIVPIVFLNKILQILFVMTIESTRRMIPDIVPIFIPTPFV